MQMLVFLGWIGARGDWLDRSLDNQLEQRIALFNQENSLGVVHLWLVNGFHAFGAD